MILQVFYQDTQENFVVCKALIENASIHIVSAVMTMLRARSKSTAFLVSLMGKDDETHWSKAFKAELSSCWDLSWLAPCVTNLLTLESATSIEHWTASLQILSDMMASETAPWKVRSSCSALALLASLLQHFQSEERMREMNATTRFTLCELLFGAFASETTLDFSSADALAIRTSIRAAMASHPALVKNAIPIFARYPLPVPPPNALQLYSSSQVLLEVMFKKLAALTISV